MATDPMRDTDPTIGKLVIDASRDISTLISKEIELAKSELKVSVRHGGTGLGLFAAAAFLGLLGVIFLSTAIVYFIHMTGLHLAWCYLIVFALYAVLAGILAFVGLRKVKKVKAPERAIRQGKAVPKALKGQAAPPPATGAARLDAGRGGSTRV